MYVDKGRHLWQKDDSTETISKYDDFKLDCCLKYIHSGLILRKQMVKIPPWTHKSLSQWTVASQVTLMFFTPDPSSRKKPVEEEGFLSSICSVCLELIYHLQRLIGRSPYCHCSSPLGCFAIRQNAHSQTKKKRRGTFHECEIFRRKKKKNPLIVWFL